MSWLVIAVVFPTPQMRKLSAIILPRDQGLLISGSSHAADTKGHSYAAISCQVSVKSGQISGVPI